MKRFNIILFGLYLATLLWLLLFKFSFDVFGVLLDHQTQSVNILPFNGYAEGLREMIDNIVVFVPFGLLLSVVFKQMGTWQKLGIIFASSVAAETIQFILAIGRTDITDVITNTLGGFIGLAIYKFGNAFISDKHLDRFIVISGAILLALLLFFRFFILKVRY